MPSLGPRPININPFYLVRLFMDLGYAPEEHESIRSKSDNNGWIKINSEDDLPKKDGYYWVIDDSGAIWPAWYNASEHEFEEAPEHWSRYTHYKSIPDPGKPLF